MQIVRSDRVASASFSVLFGDRSMSTLADNVSAQLLTLVRATLDIGSDVDLRADADLIAEVGLDSIEAFEVLAALHALLGARIPKDLDPQVVRSVRGMSDYVLNRFAPDVVEQLVEADIAAKVAAMRSVDTLE
jgi:acyl carrier protein